jgi:hypothetical protein
VSLRSLLDHLGIDTDMIEIVEEVDGRDRVRFLIPPDYIHITIGDPEDPEFDCS